LVEAARILEAGYVVVHASQPGWAELGVRLLDVGLTPVVVSPPPMRGRMWVGDREEGEERAELGGFLWAWDPVGRIRRWHLGMRVCSAPPLGVWPTT